MVVKPHPGVRVVDGNVTYVTAGVKEVFDVDVGGANGGTWRLTIDGQSVDVPFDASAAALETLIEALSTVTAATVTGGGSGPSDPWTVTIDDPTDNFNVLANGANLRPRAGLYVDTYSDIY